MRRHKQAAAFVIISWMATVVAFWGHERAGQRAVGDGPCEPSQLLGLSMELGMPKTAPDAFRRLTSGGHPDSGAEADCLRRGLSASLFVDSLYVAPAYAVLTVAIFTLAAFDPRSSKRRTAALLGAGISLAVAVTAAEVTENRLGLCVLDLAAGSATPPYPAHELHALGLALTVKWVLLALTGAVIAICWRRRWLWPGFLRLSGAGAAVVLGVGLALQRTSTLEVGAIVLFGFWSVALLQAILAALAPSSPPGSVGPLTARGDA